MNNLLPPTLLDGYKIDHRRQYPQNSTLVFSNFTSRGTRVEGLDKVVFFGLQYFIKRYLIEDWNTNFFAQPVEKVVKSYNRRLLNYVGPNQIGDQHIRDLHALGYLPLEIWALPEGSNVNLRVPMFVVWNTNPKFYWLTNAIETILSTTIWMPCTSATTALMYRKLLSKWVDQTNPEMKSFVDWMAHDFSFRGHASCESAMTSGAGHLLSFTGTDTVPAIDFLEQYYNADSDNELVGGSVAASEHSVACMGSTYVNGIPDDYAYFDRMITEVYPNGIVSLVSDTFDLFNVVDPKNGILVRLKDKIMARDGKVVIRPDSGDPVKIVTGYLPHEYYKKIDESEIPSKTTYYTDDHKELTELEVKGLIQCLWEIFGGTVSSTGYKQLDSHIGSIYGDAITLERTEQIGKRLADKGFAMTNIVLGVGSFTYNGAVTSNGIVTRDLHQFAVKSTYGEVLENGVVKGIEIFKDPKTDSGMKKSAKGLTAVFQDGDNFILKDQATWEEVKNCAFIQVFENGKETHQHSLANIRERVAKNF